MPEHQAEHIPVLTSQLLQIFKPEKHKIIVDCTLGLGGHAEAILKASDASTQLIGLDLDRQAIETARRRLSPFASQLTLVHANFGNISHIQEELNIPPADLIYADLGLSSLQIGDASRGFSFRNDGPLDMRMDTSLAKQASDMVNSLKEEELSNLIFRYGEEGKSRKIAKLICKARRERRILSTVQLADIVCQALGVERGRLTRNRIHPATRTFQAFRIAINNEITNLEHLLKNIPSVLKKNGIFAVISFHSLEDRMVKENFRDGSKKGSYRLITTKPITADPTEILRNPRARSAKFRAVQKV